MNNAGDAAEQVVRLSLEGFEVAAKVTGETAKNIAFLLISVLKEEQKTKGKARLTNMIRSGKELKVFSVKYKDLKEFTKEAKRYGVLYNVLRDKNSKNPDSVVDIIARAEDCSKIQRIFDKLELACVDKAQILNDTISERSKQNKNTDEKKKSEIVVDQAMENSTKEDVPSVNPQLAKTEKDPLSEQNYKKDTTPTKQGTADKNNKPSVRKKLQEKKAKFEKQIKSERTKNKDVKNLGDMIKTYDESLKPKLPKER